jgi:WD40 repeat protein
VLPARKAGPTTAAFSPDGRTLALGHDDGTITRWIAATGRPAGPDLGRSPAARDRDEEPVTYLSFDPGAPRLLAYANNVLSSWDLSRRAAATDVLRRRGGPPAAVDRPHRLAATVSRRGALTLRNVASGRALGAFVADPVYDAVAPAAFSADSTLLAIARLSSGLSGAFIDVFDVRTRQPIARLKPDGFPGSIAFAPSGHVLAAAARDGIRTWRLDESYVRTRACQLVTGVVSRKDWMENVGSLDRYRPVCGRR